MIIKEFDVIDAIEVPSAEICIYSNGIMHVHITVKNSFELNNSLEIVEARTTLAKGKKLPILYTTEYSFVTPSKEVNNYIASTDRAKLVLADAFVMKSLPQRLAARTYKLFKTPSVPTEFFSNEYEAVDWLKEFV